MVILSLTCGLRRAPHDQHLRARQFRRDPPREGGHLHRRVPLEGAREGGRPPSPGTPSHSGDPIPLHEGRQAAAGTQLRGQQYSLVRSLIDPS
eukprot:1194507-Prorocentrum_minimum.AAC.3